jgi:hypothetical protein
MKNSVLLSLCSIALFALSACDNVDGQVKINKALVANVNGKAATIPAGIYNATVEGKANLFVKEIALDLKMQGGTVQIPFKIPSGVTVPEHDGELKLAAAQSGQPFDLDGKISSDTQDGPEQAAVESCTRTETEQECDARGCHTATITISGQQDVRYYYSDLIRTVNVTFTKAGVSLATFNGQRDDQSKHYTYQGICF